MRNGLSPEGFLDELNRVVHRRAPTVKQTWHYEEDAWNTWNGWSWCEYLIVVIVSTILLVGVLEVALFWVILYRGGFAWSESPALQFNLHPILMIAGFITLLGFSILTHRLCRCITLVYVKLLHMFFLILTVPCAVLGFLSVFNSQNALQKSGFCSLHSWLGLVTMGVFGLQFLLGFVSFLVMLRCERSSYRCRSAMVPIHASLGLSNFWLAVATAITGLIEIEYQTAKDDHLTADTRLIEHYITSAIGIIMIAIGIIIAFAVRRTNSPASAKVYVTERL